MQENTEIGFLHRFMETDFLGEYGMKLQIVTLFEKI